MRDDVTIYCVRHGQTSWNAEARYQGKADIPLNELGREQAARNGQAMRKLLPAIAQADFVASPLIRAKETMRIMRSELGLPPEDFRIDDRLREVHYGHWEGQLSTDLPTTDPTGLSERKKDPFNWRPEGGESYADLMTRVIDWLESVDRDTVVAAHGGVSRSLRGHLAGADMDGVLQLVAPQDKILVIKQGQMSWM